MQLCCPFYMSVPVLSLRGVNGMPNSDLQTEPQFITHRNQQLPDLFYIRLEVKCHLLILHYPVQM